MTVKTENSSFSPAVGLHPRLYRGLKVGLLGGSFNPAHEGHLHISRQALRRLGLDHVWWLVSPQNPLKPERGMAALARRVDRAAHLAARDPRIRATDLETRLGTRYTVDTVRALKARYPGVHFVWLMGADNLAGLHRWHHWRALMRSVPVAVFDRPGYAHKALTGKAARRYMSRRLTQGRVRTLAARKPPAWVFLHGPLSDLSATEIRRRSREWTAGQDSTEQDVTKPDVTKPDVTKHGIGPDTGSEN